MPRRPKPPVETPALDDPTASPPDHRALVARVARAIERELTDIEQLIGKPRTTPARRTLAERRARTLASLARTLAEVRKLTAESEAEKTVDADAVPRDLDDFRRTLSQRLEQMVEAPESTAPGGND